MGYEHTNSKGQKYYLHQKMTSRGANLRFFSKDPTGSIDLPDEYTVIEGPTGLPMIKKKG